MAAPVMLRVTARLKQFNNLELPRIHNPSSEHRASLGCAPLPFQPCTFRAVISLSLYTNHKHRDRRRERASLLCYFLLHKYITQESQTLHPSSPMLVSLVRFFSSLQGRMSKYTGKVHQSQNYDF